MDLRRTLAPAGHALGLVFNTIGRGIASGWLAVRRFHWRIRTPAIWLAFVCFFGFLIAGACGYNLKGTWWEIAAGVGYAYGLIVSRNTTDPDAVKVVREAPAPPPPPPRCECCGQIIPS